MATSIAALKNYFLAGKKPTQSQFAELIEAFVHRDDDLGSLVGGMAETIEAQEGNVTDKYMSPYLTKLAIISLTRLATNPELKTEVEILINALETTLEDMITDHIELTNNPHGVTKSQVGLGDLPNAKSDLIDLDNSDSLATSKAVKLLGDAKESTFSKNTGFNKNFGTTSGTVSEGNHKHATLEFSGVVSAEAKLNSVDFTKKINGFGELLTQTTLEIKPNTGNFERRCFLIRNAADAFAHLRVDTTSGAPNNDGIFEFKEDGDMTFSASTNRIRDRATGTVIGSTSDARLKRNVETVTESLTDKIMELRPVMFLFNNKEDEGKEIPDRFGFIAQEVEELFPELVDTSEQGYKSIDYSTMSVLLTKTIQEQQTEIDALTARMDELERRLTGG